ncbi:MAG: hypothetical protein IIX60_05300 [Clostridia bacterium]|nr:hypothetical protein [Clostridia bacterium]
MFRITGLILLSLSVASIGFLYTENLNIRKRYLQQLVLFSNSLTNEMKSRNSNVFSIFSNVSVKELAFLKNITKEDISDIKSIKEKVKCAGVFSVDVDAVASFIVKLGASDIEGQNIHCKYYSNVFFDRCQDAEKVIFEKGKPARILSVLSSLALFIILI